ncbi:unnamed protein product [Nezara viridula]|uniref:Uncharacterized protein n=1 Tax=Nezara viridula TaxID=85310 RepID=A0A9P0E2N3_NEZVI|nr:unnamed protein product [Nezara viridula]
MLSTAICRKARKRG